MEIFGTVATAIGLAAKLKITFEQAGYNKNEGITLCSDIQTSLSRIDGYLKQESTSSSDGLRQDLSKFEKELTSILGHQELLTKQGVDGLWDRSATKLKSLYNAGDIKHSLAQLRQEIQVCEQNLQRSCTIRIDGGVSAVLQNLESLQRQVQMLVEAQIPSSNPKRMATLGQIEENIQDHISVVDTDGALCQQLDRIRTMNGSQAALSVKTAKFSLRSFSSSTVEKGYIKRRVKQLETILPRLRDQAVRQGTLLWFRDPFKGLVVWESSNVQKRSQEESIRETLRILESLRSKQMILYVDAARDLFSLGRALGDLGMREEASVMYDWGVQICREIACAGNSRMLLYLVQFLSKMFVDLVVRGQVDDGRRALEHAVEIRAQLGKVDQETYMAKQASLLDRVGHSARKKRRHEDASKIYQETVAMRQGLVEKNRDTYLPDLASSLHNLGSSVHAAGRCEDAVKIKQEASTIRRELVERNRDIYLPDLVLSLHNLGYSLRSAGRYEDAVKVGKEAISMCRELVERDRDIYLPDLLSALHNLRSVLLSAGRDEDAVKPSQEAVALRLELVASNRHDYFPDLASPLCSVGNSDSPIGFFLIR